MSILVILSILVRVLNFFWSIALVRRVRDWRLAFLPPMMILTVLRQTIDLFEDQVPLRITWSMPISEIPGLILSGLTFLLLFVLERIFTEREQVNRELQISLERYQQAEKERETFVRELENKNAELERFTYTVSHDLKSPLVTIRGFVGLLRRDAIEGNSQRVVDDVERIDAAAAKMARLLNELLELSRIGRVVNKMETVSLSELANEAATLVSGSLSSSGTEISIAADLPAVRVDRPRLLEVFQNLIENAIKFKGDQENPKIEIGQKKKGEETVFFVCDQGLGIESRFHDKIFGLFDRLNPHVEGTGVGLALVKRIIEVHGGKIWVESDGLGKGSCFCFTLPSQEVVDARYL